ncbi:MAG: helix-hairpin-helix domain-containing protein, partial [Prevotellaceae bacterium]|nr:helix-hairpin-helix domain-containing protein [Prevotellaceae bacterium]
MTFSRGERRGLLLLSLLLLLLLIAPPAYRLFVPPQVADADVGLLQRYVEMLGEAVQPQYEQLYESAGFPRDKAKSKAQTFTFDPNTISLDSLVLLGFSEKQAAAIARYRERGGQFRSPADFFKLNIITDKQKERLSAYVDIAARAPKAFPKRDSAFRRDSTRWVAAAAKPVVELNAADTALLRTLPGIGAYFAQKIVSYRQQLGGYVTVEQLLEINNFGQERLQRLTDRVSIDASAVQKFELSAENVDALRRHPYIGAYAARGIAQFSKRKGSPATLDELLSNNLLTSQQAAQLSPY